MTHYIVSSNSMPLTLCTDGTLCLMPLEPWQTQARFPSMTEAAIALFELSAVACIPVGSFYANLDLTIKLIIEPKEQLTFCDVDITSNL